MVIFVCDDGQFIGCLIVFGWLEFMCQGMLIYFDVGFLIQVVFDCVKVVGGEVIMECFQLFNDIGYIVQFIDSEGNCLVLYVMY